MATIDHCSTREAQVRVAIKQYSNVQYAKESKALTEVMLMSVLKSRRVLNGMAYEYMVYVQQKMR